MITTTSPPSTRPSSSTTQAPTPASCIARLGVRLKVGQLVMPAVYGPQLSADAGQYAAWGVGGAALMTAPIDSSGTSLQAFKRAGRIPLLIATDEEGGDVQRLRGLGPLPSEQQVARTMSPPQAQAMIAAHGAKVKALGVDVVWGPVVDVAPVGHPSVLGDRLFSSDPNTVATFGAAYVAGWESAGLIPTLKHFPGHGSASADTHEGAAVTPALAQMQARDLLPYARLAHHGEAVMVGHLDVPGLTDALAGDPPASINRHAVTDVLRGEMGYGDALVFSDSLNMGAIAARLDLPAAAEASIEAGADIAIFTVPQATPAVIDRLEQAATSGRLPASQLDASVGRVLAAKHVDPCTLALP